MFAMKVEKQMKLHDRTLLLGKPQFDIIPKQVNIKNEKINVIGISNGIVPPYKRFNLLKIADFNKLI